jgi:hypothetical protein
MDFEKVYLPFELAGDLTKKSPVPGDFRTETVIPLVFNRAGLAGRTVKGVLPVIDPAGLNPLFISFISTRGFDIAF